MPLNPGDRIAQLVIAPVVQCEIVEVGELSETSRGSGGFGSTGVSTWREQMVKDAEPVRYAPEPDEEEA